MKKWMTLVLALVMAMTMVTCAAGEQDLTTTVVEGVEADSYRKELSIDLIHISHLCPEKR